MAAPTTLLDDVDTVVLDVFGTIIDSGPLDLAAGIHPILKGARVNPDANLEWEDVHIPLDECRRTVFCGPESTRMFWESYIKLFLERQELTYDDVFADGKGVLVTGLALAEYSLYAGAHLLPGAIEAIQELRRRGYRVALCSNTNECGLATIVRLGLASMFSYRDLAISSLVGRQKVPTGDDYSIFSWLKYNLSVNSFRTIVIDDERRYTDIAVLHGFRTIRLTSAGNFNAPHTASNVLDAVRLLPPAAAN